MSQQGEPTEREWLEGQRYEDKFPSSEGKRTIEGKRCIACGEPVRVVTAEGTSHYESVAASEVERLREQRDKALAAKSQQVFVEMLAEAEAEVERLTEAMERIAHEAADPEDAADLRAALHPDEEPS